MRGVLAVLFVCVVAQPCLAKNFLKSEPYFLAPFSVVYVDNGVCGAGKVLRVKGALGGIRRQKTCVPIGREEASRASVTR
ncbi:MAG: hypothetical protein HY242_09555 [Afipia sp.]|nr:hypothetical protein [Afipia sp.]